MPRSNRCRDRATELVVSMAGAVQSQLKGAITAFIDLDEVLAKKIIEKDDYIDNLYVYTESELFSLLDDCDEPNRLTIIRTALKIAKGLEKIADYSENIAKQSLHILDSNSTNLSLNIRLCYEHAKEGLNLVIEAFISQDMELAKRAAKKEVLLDEVYTRLLKQVLEKMCEGGQNVKYLITQIFVAKHLEKIGDTLLDMAEESLMLISGERLKVHQYIHLTKMLKDSGGSEISLEGMWGTRSGSTIFRIESDGTDTFIYKDGNTRKIKLEVEKLREWSEIEPGLVPDVISTITHKDRQVAVTSFFDGLTLQEIYSKFWWSEKELVTNKLLEILKRIWEKTIIKKKAQFDVVEQITSRLEGVYSMHSDLNHLKEDETIFCGYRHAPLSEILDKLEQYAKVLRSPFSVYIHGDLNTDNILFQPDDGKIQFIDVNRSKMGDYLQDISVITVSNLRTPTVSGLQRQEMADANKLMIDFARKFALKHGDKMFDERLAVLTGRSLITSARFIGNYQNAKQLFLKGIESLEWALARLEKA